MSLVFMKACTEISHFYFRYMGGLKTGFGDFVLHKCCSLLRCLGMSRFWCHVSCSFRRRLSGQLWLSGLWTLISEVHGILSNKNSPSTSGGNNHRLHVLGGSWTALDFLCLVFIRWPLVFKESIV